MVAINGDRTWVVVINNDDLKNLQFENVFLTFLLAGYRWLLSMMIEPRSPLLNNSRMCLMLS